MIIAPLRRIVPSVGPTVIPGSVSYTSPGVYYFTVPNYRSLFADVRGASGGGGGMEANPGDATDGTAGGYSYFNAQTGNLIAYAGAGGTHGSLWTGIHGSNGAHGGSANGDYNGVGDATTGGYPSTWNYTSIYDAGYGGNGARCYRTWSKGSAVAPKSVIQVVVGAAGSPGVSSNPVFNKAGGGQNGAVYITWS